MEAEDTDIRFPPTDTEGPESSPFRMWVKTATKLHFQNATENQKQLQIAEKSKKQMSEAELQATHKRLLMDHDTCAGAKGMTPEEMARHMSQHGGGSGAGSGAFQGRVADIGDVTALAPEPHAEAEDEGE